MPFAAFWKMSDTTDSVGTANLTNHNGVTFPAGKIGNAALLVAANSHWLDCPLNAGIQWSPGQPWVMSLWFKRSAVTVTTQVITTATDSNVTGWYLQLSPNGGLQLIQYRNNDTTSTVTTAAGVASDTLWHHLIMWHDALGDKLLRLRFDNGAVVSGGLGVVMPATVPTGTVNFAGAATVFFDGLIDAVGIGHFVPTTAQQDALWNAGAGMELGPWPPPLPFTAFWPLSDAFDVVGNRTLINNNGVTFAAGKIGNAAHFVKANTQTLTGPLDSGIQWGAGQNWCISFWIKRGVVGNEVITQGLDASSNGWYIQFSANSQVQFFQLQAGDFTFYVQSAVGSVIADGLWHHILCWFDTTDNKLRLRLDNGTVIVSATARAMVAGGAGNLSLGTSFGGDIDALGIGKFAPTPDQQDYLWNGGAGVEVAAPVSSSALGGNKPMISLSVNAALGAGVAMTLNQLVQQDLATRTYPTQAQKDMDLARWQNAICAQGEIIPNGGMKLLVPWRFVTNGVCDAGFVVADCNEGVDVTPTAPAELAPCELSNLVLYSAAGGAVQLNLGIF
jgi:hypothetical protein